MKKELLQLKRRALEEILKVGDIETVQSLKNKYLGRKGKLTLLLRSLGNLSKRERPKIGKLANEIKKEIQELLTSEANKLVDFGSQQGQQGVKQIDVTQPGIQQNIGHLHIVTQSILEIEEIFSRLGFNRVRYPEVETDWYAFESLNMPKNHPARDEWETFYIAENIVLTPHTSSGQVREMEKGKLPIKMMNISKCHRREIDISHVPMFHQFEGLYVDKNVSISQLKGVIKYFVKNFFGENRDIRLRPFHFKFTEPSFEVDINCSLCNSKGCRFCKDGWVELGGAGMVHPYVLKNGGINPNKYSGFAFGWGVERVYMMKSGIKLPDIRLIYKNDLRFLNQF